MRVPKIIAAAGTLLAAFAATAPAQDSTSSRPAYHVLGGDRGKISLVAPSGKVEWQYPGGTTHDIARLASGNIMFISGAATVVEVSPDKAVVWKYESKPKAGYNGKVEVHAFQRLPSGDTMIAETGNLRIIEVDRDGQILHTVPLTVENPSTHSDTRLARKLANDHYLVCHENDGAVREYDPAGKVVWSYKLGLNNRPATAGHGGHGDHVYGAVRKLDGNTLIATGNGNRVIEVNPAGKVVWSVEHDELPGIRLAWVTTLHLLPDGNLIIGNCHAGPDNPQLIEITRAKKVVWTFKDFKTFGNDLAASAVFGDDADGKTVQPEVAAD
ncbi:MAG: PQQ-like beta-propeller repeat protein [Planctomycetia bacterium]|nr:PQQ-like beta-propeller repeat protein [Planctomycetia bacterium]